jgi:hypothetical protein
MRLIGFLLAVARLSDFAEKYGWPAAFAVLAVTALFLMSVLAFGALCVYWRYRRDRAATKWAHQFIQDYEKRQGRG